MILKKPYAFLIKYFKIIHAVLALMYVYLAFKTSSLLNYYSAFAKRELSSTLAINYLGKLPFFVIIISFIICIILFVLMNYKKKPKLLYGMLIFLYIAVFVIIILSYSGLNTIYLSVLDSKSILLYRDLLRISLIFQYASIVFVTIRAIGFDLKKFNFSEDIHDLDIDITDDEEVELVMGVDKHKIVQKINRRLRELRYYYEENKIFALATLGVILLIFLSTITIDKTFINKVYKENEVFSSDNFDMNIVNSYVTFNSYDGTVLSNEKSFVIIKLLISPKNANVSLNTTNMLLKIGKNSYNVTKKYNKYFKDIGSGYENQIIKTSKTYLLIYEIPREIINKKMNISYIGNNKELKVSLSPINLDANIVSKEYKITELIDFNNTSFDGGFVINSYELKSKYVLDYTYEINGKEYNGKKNVSSMDNTILKAEINYYTNSSVSLLSFLKDYSKMVYTKDNEEKEAKIISDKTPNGSGNTKYLEVSKELESADSIWLEINIRNFKYKYLLK